MSDAQSGLLPLCIGIAHDGSRLQVYYREHYIDIGLAGARQLHASGFRELFLPDGRSAFYVGPQTIGCYAADGTVETITTREVLP